MKAGERATPPSAPPSSSVSRLVSSLVSLVRRRRPRAAGVRSRRSPSRATKESTKSAPKSTRASRPRPSRSPLRLSASSRLFLVRSRLCDCRRPQRRPRDALVCSATRNAAHVEARSARAKRALRERTLAEAWLAFVAEERGSANEADVASSRGPIESRLCRRRGGGEVSGMRRVSSGAARLLWGRRVGRLVSTFPIRSFSISKQSVLFVVCDQRGARITLNRLVTICDAGRRDPRRSRVGA